MSLASTIARSVAIGAGNTGIYPWNWLVNDPSQLHVAVLSPVTTLPQVLTVLTYGTDFTIQTPGIQIGAASGGNIVLTNTGFFAFSGGNLPTGWSIVIRRIVTFGQPSTLGNQAGFNPSSIESMCDYLAMQNLQLLDALNHTVQTPLDDYATPTQGVALASARANQFLAFDGSGNPISSPGPIAGVPVGSFGGLLAQTAAAFNAQGLLGIPYQIYSIAQTSNAFGTPNLPAAPVQGGIIFVNAASANTGASTLTVNIAGTGNVTYPIQTANGSALSGGELAIATTTMLVFQSSAWRIMCNG
jgi:hypothetical protein